MVVLLIDSFNLFDNSSKKPTSPHTMVNHEKNGCAFSAVGIHFGNYLFRQLFESLLLT